MVSMSPNTLHYNFSNTWRNLCDSNDCGKFGSLHLPKTVNDNLFDVISKNPTLTKMTKIIEKGNLQNHFKNGSYTLFVTEDVNIPDSFIDNLDYYNARKFVLSYTIKSRCSIEYLLEQGDAVYESSQVGSPILSIVTNRVLHDDLYPIESSSSLRRSQQPEPKVRGDIVINKVGKIIRHLPSSTGNIIIMNNMANVLN